MRDRFVIWERVALGIVVLLLMTSLTLGQGIVTGSISGTVLDPQGAVVAGANVRAVQTETNRSFTTTSSNSGLVQLSSLPPGTYIVTVEAKGFAPYTVREVVVEVGKDVSLGVVGLKLGNTAETVTVEGAAPLVENTTDQITETFSNTEVANIPLGNTYDSFVLFAPGVATVGAGGFENNNGAELSINGQRGRSNNYQLDGQNNNDNTIGGPSFFFGNQDAIAELQVVTNFDAEYGRNMGGVVNYITKQGTNSFHGTGYDFWQGDTFDSLQNQEKSPLLGFCPSGVSPSTGCIKPVVPQYVQNQFGGTIGGPIRKDKIWFFGSANFQRNRAGGAPVSSNGALAPDATGIQQLEAAFPNDPAVTALAQSGPAAVKLGNPVFSNLQTVNVTGPGGVTTGIEMGSVTRFLSQPFNDYEATGRADFQLTSKDRFFTRYLFQQQGQSNIPLVTGAQGQIYTVFGRNQQIGLDLTHTFTPTLLNQVRFSYSRSISEFDGGGFPTCLLSNQSICPPQISILDSTYLGAGQSVAFPQGRLINIYELQDNASMVHGKHVMKWGGSYDRQRSPNYGLFEQNGLFVFNEFNDLIQNQNSFETQVAYGQPVLRFKENDLALYFQDDFRVKENLTLNLGLRWEFYQQAGNLLHDESVAQQTGPNHLWDQSLPLNLTTVPKLPNHYHNFGPVIGFAWTPRILPSLFGSNQTVIRGGFRIAYDFAYYNLATNIEGTSPFTNLATIPNAAGTGGAGIPSAPVIDGATVQAGLFPLAPKGNPGFATELQFGSNFRNPYSEQWNFGIQRQIGGKMAAEVRYVGNHDIGNFQEINGNPAIQPLIANGFGSLVPQGVSVCNTPGTPGYQLYVNCNYSRVIEYANTGYSIYHGLQSQLRLQHWHGFTGQASYTFSKTIDNASEAFSSLSGSAALFNLAQNPFDLSRAERGLSSYDYPHVLGLLWVYDLPYRHQQSGLLGHLLGGWQINGTYRYTSGQPWTVVQNAGQGLCDPADFTGGTIDACRPFLGDTTMPFNSVGFYCDGSPGACPTSPTGTTGFPAGTLVSVSQSGGCVNTGGLPNQCAVTPITTPQHWYVNNVEAAKIFGSPFLGVGRNTERGQPISTVNMAVFKNTRVTERLTIQFQAEAFNLFNHQWLGIPNVDVNTAYLNGVNEFGTTAYNPNGGLDGGFGTANIITDGIGRRRLQFGAKVIF
jgi:hypothetical protein